MRGALAALMLFSFLSHAQPAARIIGGNVLSQAEFPDFVVSQQLAAQHNCGAVMLSGRWIIAAAHCTPEQPEELLFRYGHVGLLQGELVSANLSLPQIHPAFERNSSSVDPNGDGIRADLALITLDRRVAQQDFKPLLPFPEALSDGALVNVVGWGENACEQQPSAFKQAQMRYRVQSNLADLLLFLSSVDNGNVCYGDSGGPAFDDNYLLGLSSWITDSDCTGDALYTDFSYHLPWLAERIDALLYPTLLAFASDQDAVSVVKSAQVQNLSLFEKALQPEIQDDSGLFTLEHDCPARLSASEYCTLSVTAEITRLSADSAYQARLSLAPDEWIDLDVAPSSAETFSETDSCTRATHPESGGGGAVYLLPGLLVLILWRRAASRPA